MRHNKKRITRIVIILFIIVLISGYMIYTFPHPFIEKSQGIKMVIIDNRELIPFKSSTSRSFSLENGNEIANIVDILNNYRYRYYIDIGNHDSGFIDRTSEIRIHIYYHNGKSDFILLYSDGQLFINYKPAHIGIIGDGDTKEMFHAIYDQYFNNSFPEL